METYMKSLQKDYFYSINVSVWKHGQMKVWTIFHPFSNIEEESPPPNNIEEESAPPNNTEEEPTV